MDNIKTYIQKIKYYYKKFILFFENRFGVHEGAVLAMIAMLLFLTIGAVAGRPARKRNLTNTPLLWAKLDGALTDENSTGSTFAYSPGKPSTETGVSIKEGDNIQYSPGNAIDSGSSVYENWNPNQGTMNVWVQANWPGNDNTRHDIWNADYGRIDTSDSNLKAYFKFDEGSEDYAFDSTSNSNIGYLHGPALSFDEGDYVDFSGFSDITGTKTAEMWVKSNDPSQTKVILYFQTGNSSDFLVIGTYQSKILASSLNNSGSSNFSGTIDTNWHYIVVIKSTGDISYIYVDGQDATAVASIYWTGSQTKRIMGGSWTTGSLSAAFNGQINNVRIYSRALSETEVVQHYAGDYSSNSGLVGFWPMDENQGQTVADMSGNGNDGTLGANSESGSDDPAWVSYAPAWTDDGRFGKGLKFDGTDDEVEMGDVNF